MHVQKPVRERAERWSQAGVNVLGALLRPMKIRGKGRIAHFVATHLARYCQEATVNIAPGFWLQVPLEDRIGRLMWVGAYEPELRKLLKNFLQPGMVFLDVGAHIGYFSVLAAARVIPEGEVHAFEVNPICVDRLIKNAETYPVIRVHTQAVSDAEGEALFFPSVRAAEYGWGSLFDDGERKRSLVVPTTTLDAWSSRRGITRVDFIKLDIEGAEYRALRGARRLLEQTRPVIFFEVNQVCLARDGRTPQDLFNMLSDLEYSVRGVLDRRSNELSAGLAVPLEKSDLWKFCERMKLPIVKN